MDHHGFLGLVRELSSRFAQLAAVKRGELPRWRWHSTVVVMPESRCPFCKAIIRSRGIWHLDQPPLFKVLRGVTMLETTKRLHTTMHYPQFPHQLTAHGMLCLGNHKDGIELLASPTNLHDVPMGVQRLPYWLKLYWDHECRESHRWLRDRGFYATNMDYNRVQMRYSLSTEPPGISGVIRNTEEETIEEEEE